MARKIVREHPKKTAVLTCKITLPDSPQGPRVIFISKDPGFRALYIARRNELRFSFNKCKKLLFFILAAGFCLKNLAAAPQTPLLVRSVILFMIFQLKLSYSFDFLVTVIVLVNYRGIF